MYLKRVDVEGYRAAATSPVTCEFTGSFNVVLGANGAGKTTINEAIFHAHRHRFPRLTPVDAAALGPPPRAVAIEYAFEDDATKEGALGLALKTSGFAAPKWSRPLERSLGRVRAGNVVDASEGHDNIRLVYLPALRNPVDDLSRRDAQVLLELLRAEQLRRTGVGALGELRALAQGMLGSITAHQLIADVQGRIAQNLAIISAGVREHFAFMGTQQVDDAYLAHVLELLLATTPSPELSRRLEASSLGYVNLLHIAVTLAGIPDPSESFQGSGGSDTGFGSSTEANSTGENNVDADAARERLHDAANEAEADQDSFFPDLFHATVLIEEPEAHLHPQLQSGLVRYLRRVANQRRDLQVIVTTHSSEIAAASDPTELIVVRLDREGRTVSRSVGALPLPDKIRNAMFEQTRLHMDADRSASLFSDRLLIVEGVTEAALLRAIGRVWASGNSRHEAFVDALSIVAIGRKVGQWPMRLLATTGFELVSRVAAISDTDLRGDPLPQPTPPAWHAELDEQSARFFWSRPTLEPSLVPGNEELVRLALERIGTVAPNPIDPSRIDSLFDTTPALKSRFALALALEIQNASESVAVPDHIHDALTWLVSDKPAEANDSEGQNSN